MKRVKLDLEFIFKASPTLLYTFITTPACLVRWFCDGVEINEDLFSFSWNGSFEDAEMVDDIEDERVRFKWLDADDESEYFEFRMYKSDVTLETILEVTDFCDQGDEKSSKDLWTQQITALRQECGG
ncbi:MAG: activator of HSP90 ATPase 1 family protein [Saprospiraceae bacterium]|nr:activator of HSP90 ATPase 1 family protein [Saprospiraceae bacterium]MBK7220844.1 activator of HSP90 ATPase 1 family protein [Saprospiraceae bacterium]MBK7789663.1 activator of HSP90 ATPase 1 family protein [Saprospiraceae bacterium]MBK8112277.1 activator of HSP90 ATPase 1 family protein [Saprospiraceae bacterium]MBK8851060.1 activator of HSP90 ATPase 1 family protein [Saprospiraceae bacterium]